MRDQMNDLHAPAAEAVTVTDNTAIVSPIVDVKGYDSLTFFVAAGTLADADATFTALLEEGDDSGLSDAAAVADADLVGTEALAGFTFADDDEPRKIGYKGSKRYVRLTVTPANNTGNAPIAIIPIQGRPHDRPTDNPPV